MSAWHSFAEALRRGWVCVVIGVAIGSLLGTIATDYCDEWWLGRIYYAFHKERHKDPSVTYSVASNITSLGDFTFEEARSTINQAAGQWNAACRYFKFSNVQTSNTTLCSIYEDSDNAAYATWQPYPRDGKVYIRAVKIEYNTKFNWTLNGDPYTYSLKGITLHEMGHFLDFDDITDYSLRDSVMYYHASLGSSKNNLDQVDKDSIMRIYDDLVWDYFGLLVSYDDGGGSTAIRGKSWQPAFYDESSSGPTNPPDMENGEERKFIVKVSGKRGAYDFNIPNLMDSTMRLIWDDTRLDRVSEGWWVQSPYTVRDTWWFESNPYWGDDTGWLCVDFQSGSFGDSDTKHAEMYVQLQAYENGIDVPVTARVTTADHHANPWVVRDDTTFRFDIS